MRLRALLEGTAPGREPIDVALGEPRVPLPGWLAETIAAASGEFAHYPPIRGSDDLRTAITAWLNRHQTPAETVDPARHVLPCCGSREGLFLAIVHVVRRSGMTSPMVLFPDPSYPVYAAAAASAGARPVPLPAKSATGFLPDLEELAAQKDLLGQSAALILGSPANPQGAVADSHYLARAATLARAHDFVLICDECYSDVFAGTRPVSALAAAGGFDRVLVFNSLSKRSGLPGLRSGFCAGDGALIEALAELRNLIGPQMPGPLQHASALAWSDEVHVEAGRARHHERLALADRHLAAWPGYRRPLGGFFLWLDISPWRDLDFALQLWSRHGLRVLPGSFLARDPAMTEASRFIRVALVHDLATVNEALGRISEMLEKVSPERAS